MQRRYFLVLGFLTGFILSGYSQIRLPQIINDHMVLQRHQPVPVWGWAKKNEKITVSFLHHTISTKADRNGEWKLELPQMNAGGPYEMTISGAKETIVLRNILIGEVWICSGQSNMEWPLSSTIDAEKEIRQANYPFIRLFDVKHNIQYQPVDNLNGEQWVECSPQTIPGFSAVAYFFGRHLHQELDVPVGLISSNWGGTNIETWTSKEAITQIEGFEKSTDELSSEAFEKAEAERKAKYDKILAEFGDSKGGLVNGNALWAAPELSIKSWKVMELPGLWEGKGLEGMDGVVWFRKVVDIPAPLAHNGGKLHFGPIDDSDITWINGQKVGETKNAYDQPRIYDIPPNVLQPGKNTIAVRVEDTGGGGGIYGKASEMYIEADGDRVDIHGDWLYRVSPQGLKIGTSMSPNAHPTLLFNGMINPLIPFAFQGVIWYQGESNAGRAYQYRTLFPTMIQDWRNQWKRDFPFLFVQLANFKAAMDEPGDSDWAELREAQLLTLNLHKTGMAVIIDIGEADDIHPRNKQDVGTRLAISARKVAYDQDIVHSGPIYKSMKKEGNKIILEFDHVGSGLMAYDRYGYLRGFSIASHDEKFVWAKASIEGDKIVVWSDQIQDPVAVRYAWADNPEDANLYNKEGLPASPFRTDYWDGITINNK